MEELQAEIEFLEDKVITLEKANEQLRNEMYKMRAEYQKQIGSRRQYIATPQDNYQWNTQQFGVIDYPAYVPREELEQMYQQRPAPDYNGMTQAMNALAQDVLVFGNGALQINAGALQGGLQTEAAQTTAITQENTGVTGGLVNWIDELIR